MIQKGDRVRVRADYMVRSLQGATGTVVRVAREITEVTVDEPQEVFAMTADDDGGLYFFQPGEVDVIVDIGRST